MLCHPAAEAYCDEETLHLHHLYQLGAEDHFVNVHSTPLNQKLFRNCHVELVETSRVLLAGK